MVSDHQVRYLMKLKESGETLKLSSLKSGMSEKTARKYLRSDLPPEYEQFKSRKYQVVAAGSGDPVCKPPSGFPQVPGTQCFAANSLGV